MALSQNEDFTIWYLRTSYLNNIKDGAAERLVNINSSILNAPGFRSAGWTADHVYRTHSPPIPTTLQSQYFQHGSSLLRQESQGDDNDEGGMVTGRTSNDTIGPGLNIKRRRRKEQIEDDDSSDLSDESDDDETAAQRAAQLVKFPKMPARERSDSSPLRQGQGGSQVDAAAVSGTRLNLEGRPRGSSLGAVEAVKARARADTTTSSEMSSENEVENGYFQRRQVRTRKSTKTRFKDDVLIHEDDETEETLTADSAHDNTDAESVDSDLSSDLEDTIESASLMDEPGLTTSSPVLPGITGPDVRSHQAESPRKQRNPPVVQDLPPPRPISFIQPISLLSNALNAQKAAPKNPVQKYAALSGQGSPSPLWIRIYVPSSEGSNRPFEMPLLKLSKEGAPIIVAEAIGLALWRYCEEDLRPSLTGIQLDVNKWSLRMVEDGEVDFDFPALQRTKPVTDFTSNNNRGTRARSREKPYDEFALVQASEAEAEVNRRETPTFSPTKTELSGDRPVLIATESDTSRLVPPPLRIVPASPRPNLLVAGQPFGSALSDRTVTPADRPAPIAAQSTPRLGVMKTVRIRYYELEASAQSTTIEVSTDSYIAEILDQVCKRWNFDKALFVLKVAGTNTMAPLDRTVEALGPRSDLELVRRRFTGATNLKMSPGSASPSTPLLLDIQGPKKSRKGQPLQHPLAQKHDLAAATMTLKKFYVTRKQLTSFSQSTSRVLIFDGDFLHNMPADTGKAFDANAKTNSFPYTDITKCKVSSKHSKLIRLVVRRTAESKGYDFEARSSAEAQEIVNEINKEVRQSRKP